MSAQTTYGYATAKGAPGGIYDMFHYPVDSRFNEEANGILRSGVGVVPGTIPGSNVKLPTADSTADQFEGVVLGGSVHQQNLEGKLPILNNQNVGVMRRGRIWVRLAAGAEPAYGDPVFMVAEGEEAGCFNIEGAIEIPGRFIGSASNGCAPVELYGCTPAAAAEGGNTETTDPGTGGTDAGAGQE